MYKITFFAIAIVAFLTQPCYTFAGIDLPWSTTYDCADWNQYNDPLSCDGLARKGSWTSSPEGYYEQITAAANYPGGAGGKGQRHWIGDGTNNNSGSLRIDFNTPPGKFWMRWYMRWESGFGEFGQYKAIYGFAGADNGPLLNFFYPGGGMSFEYLSSGNETCNNCGWGTQFYGSGTSDGSWVLMEMMVDAAGGKLKLWVNETLVMDRTGVVFKQPYVTYLIIGSNQKNVSNGRSMYVDYDDIAISTTGYIGPIGGGGNGGGGQDTSYPTTTISYPTQGDSIAGTVNLTAVASDNVGVVGLQFKIDGKNFGTEDTIAPYSVTVDTTTVTDGPHTLTALARDAVGNVATSTPVDFIVNNSNASGPIVPPEPTASLFSESFEDNSFSSRGWYDNTNLQLSTVEHIPGSKSSVQFLFNTGAITPASGPAIRHLFDGSDSIYVSYYVKYSSNWVGSNHDYHPHEFFIMTNIDGAYDGMGSTHLTVYVEQNVLRPLLNLQDSDNIDTKNIGNDLVGQTEIRAVGGCNGDSDGHGNGDCYQSGQWRNDKHWLYNSAVITVGAWHKVEAYFKLNTISGGIGQQDGIMQYWLDGNQLMDYHDIVFRTGQHPGMKFNQFIIAPYIGDGSPVTQTFWVDDLTVATSKPAQSVTIPATPPNLRVE